MESVLVVGDDPRDQGLWGEGRIELRITLVT